MSAQLFYRSLLVAGAAFSALLSAPSPARAQQQATEQGNRLEPLPPSDAGARQQAPTAADTTPPEPQPSDARPDAQPPSATQVPRLHHAPPAIAPAGELLSIAADIEMAHLVRRAILVYRVAGSGAPRELVFQRASSGPYAAMVPAADVRSPALDYAIELELLDGSRVPVFASRSSMFRVSVPENLTEMRERALLQRLDGRRSVVTAFGEFVRFGKTDATVIDPETGIPSDESVSDQYYRLEAGYTYRPLGTVAEFSIRLGVVRGRALVPGETDDSKFDVGLNYASPKVRFRLGDAVHLETELLTSVTEVGFSTGVGGALLLGDAYGSHLTFGFETVRTFGTRIYSRLDIAASDTVRVAPIIEVTDMPHADRFGLRLLTEIGADVGGGWTLAARGGYQARTFTSGGPSAAAIASYAF